MYTSKHITEEDEPGTLYWFGIYDPDGDFLCCVSNPETAAILLSHLNR